MKNIEISVAKDFSPAPGGRFKSQGDHSGEEFRDDILRPKLDVAIRENITLICNLDGCLGYPSSFLDESFGQLGREMKKKGIDILKYMTFISKDEPSFVENIQHYIRDN